VGSVTLHAPPSAGSLRVSSRAGAASMAAPPGCANEPHSKPPPGFMNTQSTVTSPAIAIVRLAEPMRSPQVRGLP